MRFCREIWEQLSLDTPGSPLDQNQELQLDTLKAALARGRKGGRRPKVKPDDVRAALALLNDPKISVRSRVGGKG